MAHRFIDHVGEIEVELEAASVAGVFQSALSAFTELVAADAEGEESCEDVELAARDLPLLLVDWLGELVFLAEVRGFVPTGLRTFELTHNHLRATVDGLRDSPRHLVKAVTLNKLELEQEGGVWRGRVVFDV